MTTTEKMARKLALYDNYQWITDPTIRQMRKQEEYKRRAQGLIEIYEEERKTLLDTLQQRSASYVARR